MQVVYSEAHRRHHPRHFVVSGAVCDSPEVPARADALLAGARSGGHEVVAPSNYGREPAAAVHTPEYLEFLERAAARWRRIEDASGEVIPNVHPQGRGPGGYPASVAGQAGYHLADQASAIVEGTWEAALANASGVAHAAELVCAGAPAAYALCRPGGHHAFADLAGGFCYLNNSAMAAARLRRRCGRVCVLDVDVHHGNGTQAIFYDRPDVLTVSLHADPVRFYPFFWGHAGERGEGDGVGANMNLPLPRGTGTEAYLQALERALKRVRAFRPEALVIALGLDAYEGDPLAGLAVSTEGFGAVGEAVGGLGLPTVLVQEGGYLSEALGGNLASFLAGFERGRPRQRPS